MDYEPLPSAIREVTLEQMAALEVPGVAVGVLHGGRVRAEGFGVTSVENPLPVTPETLFQIGSTSKTVTATAVMQLVDEGRLALDSRVRSLLPSFSLLSAADSERLTVRDLLTHHGGWNGDYFPDTGRGDDAIARVVDLMARSEQIVPAGTAFSYNNAGFHVLARIIEVLEREPFDVVVRRRLFVPLQMERTCYAPEDAMTYRFAVGHIRTAEGPKVARPWPVARGRAGGGGVISNVLDQLRYAKFHLGDGLGPGGHRLLQPETLRLMQTPQAEAGSVCRHIGLSWMLDPLEIGDKVKHGGATAGQLSSFEMVPALGYACTVLTNADSGRGLRDAVGAAAMRTLLGFEPQPPSPAAVMPSILAEHAGRYQAMLHELTVAVHGEHLIVREERRGAGAAGAPRPLAAQPATALVVDVDRCVILDGPRRGEHCEFLRDAGGHVSFLRWDGRLARRLPA